ncbi:hypothetical protein IQ07DRAFT_632569 [Pyrenochaeta sp. DS3sAY3a]|nr:hypothetical protein IQ07DRAFT_632569 [Pyrenochaeta sp. DS3sAY3a]
MPIRKAEKKFAAPPPGTRERTGEYSQVFSLPQAYKAIQPKAVIPASFAPGSIPSISTRDLSYFFTIAASLYQDSASQSFPSAPDFPQAVASTGAPPAYDGRQGYNATPGYNAAPGYNSAPGYNAASAYSVAPGYSAAPPGYAEDFRNTSLDASAILVMRIFRQTRIDIHPIAERFHFGPADRQPLYSLTAQPSIRSATEYNELLIQRRDPIDGVWYHTCTSDIEPTLDLARSGNWTVARLILESMPVWKKVASGQVLSQAPAFGKGNSLRLAWGDRQTLGHLGDAYGLWWDSGIEGGLPEAFYLIEGWMGFDSSPQGIIRVKPVVRDANGRIQDPRNTLTDLAVVYFHPGGKTPPQFVCMNTETHVRLDIIMAGLMTVLVIETRKVSVVKELGALPAYNSDAHWNSTFVQ